MRKIALVTGIGGQDAHFMSKFLHSKGYTVYGMIRGQDNPKRNLVEKELPFVRIIEGDLLDQASIINVINRIKPDEIYNLGAISFVPISWEQPMLTFDTNSLGVLRLLEAIKAINPKTKLFQAGCYSDDTYIVTRSGLKTINEVQIGDFVLSINPNTSEIEEKTITKLIKDNFCGNMIHIKTRSVDLLVTPNHKLLVNRDTWNKLKFINADHKFSTTPHQIPSGKWTGKDIDDVIDIGGYFSNFNSTNNNHSITKYSTNDLLYLVGLFIGDGYVSSKRTYKVKSNFTHSEFVSQPRNSKGQFREINNSLSSKDSDDYRVFLYIPDSDKSFDKVSALLDRMGLKWAKHPSRHNMVCFTSSPLSKFLKSSCGDNAYNKTIPDWVLELPPHRLIHLYNGLIDSDGCRKKNGSESFYSVSKVIETKFIELCIKLGFGVTVCKRSGNFVKIKNRTVISKPSLAFNISGKTWRKNTHSFSKRNITTIPYNGNVWCVEVADNHNLLVYRNGKVAFCGNSSEQFGKVFESPQNENTPFYPRSPYGISKVAAFHLVRNYRESYGLFACSALSFNHASEIRPPIFVTRKVTSAVARILKGQQEDLKLGNIEAKRDWGYSGDFVRAYWMMLQADKPDDYVVATNETHTIQELCEEAFSVVDLDWSKYVKIDNSLIRPAEVDLLQGDYTKIKNTLGWEPTVKFKELVSLMVKHDISLLEGK